MDAYCTTSSRSNTYVYVYPRADRCLRYDLFEVPHLYPRGTPLHTSIVPPSTTPQGSDNLSLPLVHISTKCVTVHGIVNFTSLLYAILVILYVRLVLL